MLTPSHKIFLSGPQSIIRTGVVKRTIQLLRAKGIELWGFYTDEMVESGRAGFAVVTLSGVRVPVAHISLSRGPKIGPYRVDVPALDAAILPEIERRTLSRSGHRSLGIIDEVGRIQCMSDEFLDRVARLIKSPLPILISFAAEGGPFIDYLHTVAGPHLVEVTRNNQYELPDKIVEALFNVWHDPI